MFNEKSWLIFSDKYEVFTDNYNCSSIEFLKAQEASVHTSPRLSPPKIMRMEID